MGRRMGRGWEWHGNGSGNREGNGRAMTIGWEWDGKGIGTRRVQMEWNGGQCGLY